MTMLAQLNPSTANAVPLPLTKEAFSPTNYNLKKSDDLNKPPLLITNYALSFARTSVARTISLSCEGSFWPAREFMLAGCIEIISSLTVSTGRLILPVTEPNRTRERFSISSLVDRSLAHLSVPL